jgi:transposase
MCALMIRDDISPEELRRRARQECDGRVAARLIAIANALEGMDRASAARLAGMDRQTLSDCVHRYNEEGIAGLSNRPAPGRSPKLTDGQMAALKAVVLAGPDPAVAGIVRWRIVDLCRWVEEAGASATAKPGCCGCCGHWTCRTARPGRAIRKPMRRRSKPSKRGFAARLSEIAQAHPEAERFEIWSQDEARVRQKGRTGYVWWQRGDTPRGWRDVGYQSAWIIGAVCPARDTGVALVMTRRRRRDEPLPC